MADVSDELFRVRMGFLGLIGIAFTCGVYLMTLLRPVLEPLLWALFLVIALNPLTTAFERILLCLGRFVCGCGSVAARSCDQRRCILRGEGSPRYVQEFELTSIPGGVGEEDDDAWRVSSHDDMESACAECCFSCSRVVAVACALAVVTGVAMSVAMLIFDAALQLKSNMAVFEKGAQNTLHRSKALVAYLFGRMPQNVADEISDNMLASAKEIASQLLGSILEHAGKTLFEVLMLGLYVMFWLCTPMPLNSNTELIFRRYLFLKGLACLCYGICVGALLYALAVDLAAVFGLMSFFFSFIPEVGALIAMILPVPVILFDSRLESPILTLFTAMTGQLALKFIFANIVEVKLVEHDATMKMHPVITLLAVTFFGFIWGPTGMLLCVPMMAYVKVVILSDLVPASYRDPILVILEGDRRAPERHRRRSRDMATLKE